MNGRLATSWRVAVVILLFSIAVRAGLLLIAGNDLDQDPDDYGRLAINWAASGTFGFPDMSQEGGYRATAFRPPLYPWLLSWLVNQGEVSQWMVLSLHVVIGVLTVLATYALSCQLFSRFSSSYNWLLGLPALAVCLDPLLLRSSQLLMTESLAALLGCAAWLAWLKLFTATGKGVGSTYKSNAVEESGAIHVAVAIGLGLVLGLAILTRPTAAPWSILLLMASFGAVGRSRSVRIRGCVLASVTAALLVGGWTYRNTSELGKPIWATSHGGYTLLLANNPALNQHFFHNGPRRNWDASRFHQVWERRDDWTVEQLQDPQLWAEGTRLPLGARRAAARSELEQDELAYGLALRVIGEDQLGFARNCVYRTTWFWAAWPNPSENGKLRVWAIGSWYAATYIFALIGAGCVLWPSGVSRFSDDEKVSLRARSGRFLVFLPWLPAFLMLSSLTAIHAVYWGNMRMRAPLMPMVYLLAMQGALVLVVRWSGGSKGGGEPIDQ